MPFIYSEVIFIAFIMSLSPCDAINNFATVIQIHVLLCCSSDFVMNFNHSFFPSLQIVISAAF